MDKKFIFIESGEESRKEILRIIRLGKFVDFIFITLIMLAPFFVYCIAKLKGII